MVTTRRRSLSVVQLHICAFGVLWALVIQQNKTHSQLLDFNFTEMKTMLAFIGGPARRNRNTHWPRQGESVPFSTQIGIDDLTTKCGLSSQNNIYLFCDWNGIIWEPGFEGKWICYFSSIRRYSSLSHDSHQFGRSVKWSLVGKTVKRRDINGRGAVMLDYFFFFRYFHFIVYSRIPYSITMVIRL